MTKRLTACLAALLLHFVTVISCGPASSNDRTSQRRKPAQDSGSDAREQESGKPDDPSGDDGDKDNSSSDGDSRDDISSDDSNDTDNSGDEDVGSNDSNSEDTDETTGNDDVSDDLDGDFMVSRCPAGFAVDESKKQQIADAVGSYQGTILVMQCNEVIYASPESDSKRYDMASVSKQFTASAIMVLEQEGKLQTSDRADKYISGYGNGATIHHLLTHTAGGVPGTNYSYSNEGYGALAKIVTKVSGMKFAEYLKQHFFTPSGMENTSGGCGPGCVDSTARDMYKWDRMLHTNRILTKDSKEKMYTPFLNDYGYGWRIKRQGGKTKVSHGGSYENVSYYIRYIDEDAVVVVQAKSGNPTKFALQLGKILTGW